MTEVGDAFGGSKNTGWKIGLVTFLLIIFFIILIVLYVFLNSDKGLPDGSSCTNSGQCLPYHRCNGDYKCQSGSKGSTGFCSKTSDCEIGYQCYSGTCSKNREQNKLDLPCQYNDQCKSNSSSSLICLNGRCRPSSEYSGPYGSFEKTDIVTIIDNSKFYLHVTSDKSFWSLSKPTYSYNYNSSTNKLYVSDNNGMSIYGISSDRLLERTSVNIGTYILLSQKSDLIEMTDLQNRILSVNRSHLKKYGKPKASFEYPNTRNCGSANLVLIPR